MAWNGWNGPASQSLSRLGMVLSPKGGKHDAAVNFTSIGTVTKKRNATEAEMLEEGEGGGRGGKGGGMPVCGGVGKGQGGCWGTGWGLGKGGF